MVKLKRLKETSEKLFACFCSGKNHIKMSLKRFMFTVVTQNLTLLSPSLVYRNNLFQSFLVFEVITVNTRKSYWSSSQSVIQWAGFYTGSTGPQRCLWHRQSLGPTGQCQAALLYICHTDSGLVLLKMLSLLILAWVMEFHMGLYTDRSFLLGARLPPWESGNTMGWHHSNNLI